MNLIKKIYNALYRRLILQSEYYKQKWDGANKFWHIPSFNLDIVNLGAESGLHAFDYSELGGGAIQGMNWALCSQSLSYDYSVLKNYFSYLKSGATVLIIISPFSCLTVDCTKKQNLKYYTFLHPATIQGFEESEHIRALILKRQNIIKSAPIKTICGVMSTWMECITNNICTCNFNKHSVKQIAAWKEQFGISDFDVVLSPQHQKELESQSKLLQEMISFCVERDLRPVLVFPPVHQSLKNYFTDAFQKHYIYDFINKGNQCGVLFMNYMFDTRFLQNKYFDNLYCLSRVGARKFTNQVLKDLGLSSS